ncbi:hypothetical protein ASD89_21765 [Caulobacter sp. Root656]|nr:hypothetical protein ASD89_21765 [Caulobacter sp. Root656]
MATISIAGRSAGRAAMAVALAMTLLSLTAPATGAVRAETREVRLDALGQQIRAHHGKLTPTLIETMGRSALAAKGDARFYGPWRRFDLAGPDVRREAQLERLRVAVAPSQWTKASTLGAAPMCRPTRPPRASSAARAWASTSPAG